jgi:Mrp family chromosome partitioning ATPase
MTDKLEILKNSIFKEIEGIGLRIDKIDALSLSNDTLFRLDFINTVEEIEKQDSSIKNIIYNLVEKSDFHTSNIRISCNSVGKNESIDVEEIKKGVSNLGLNIIKIDVSKIHDDVLLRLEINDTNENLKKYILDIEKIINEIVDCSGKIRISYTTLSQKDYIKNDSQEEEKETKSDKKKRSIDGVKNIIIIASGKGGVGKSTIATNLAVTMAKIGWKVGLLDADIYGASIPTIFSINERDVELDQDSKMLPFESHSVKINSIEFLSDKHEALIWRGPMLAKILDQLMYNTKWGDLDFLIIDTPPGTGDIHISLLEKYEIDGYILVSTEHKTSINNSKKTENMFEKFGVKSFGLVLNMIGAFGQGTTSILSSKVISNIPLITGCNEIFAMENKYEKFFIEICREVIKQL